MSVKTDLRSVMEAMDPMTMAHLRNMDLAGLAAVITQWGVDGNNREALLYDGCTADLTPAQQELWAEVAAQLLTEELRAKEDLS